MLTTSAQVTQFSFHVQITRFGHMRALIREQSTEMGSCLTLKNGKRHVSLYFDVM